VTKANRQELVRRGYDAAAERYCASRSQDENQQHLELFVKQMPPPARVLDVGCGCGVPIDRSLVERGYEVIGIDLSPKQIALAKRFVPGARFEVRDMLDLALREYEVDGVVSFYAIFHTPREHHGRLLRTLTSFLRPGGVLLVTMGARAAEGIEPDFHGVPMFWSHYESETNHDLVEAAGLQIKVDEIVETADGECHQILFAGKSGSSVPR
jgi:cyclopropane fatty-acyl-phospholipid synthase-like methyltransferase